MLLGELHMAWLDDGRFVYVPAWDRLDSERSDNGSDETNLESPEAAALVILCRQIGCDPLPATAEEHRLRNLPTARLREEVATRTGWVCHLCGERIPARLRDAGQARFDPLFPDVDHLVPLKAGGPHWWSNLSLTHHACNVAAGGPDASYESETRAMLRLWLRDHPKARPCPVDSVDPAHYGSDGICNCWKVMEDARRREHPLRRAA
jgi:hypothetical protein